MNETISKQFLSEDLGLINYGEAYNRQMECVKLTQADHTTRVLMCEHDLTITLGRMASKEHILVSEQELNEKGVKVIPVNRGGDVTLHSPGQLVVYPIVDLNNARRDLHYYLYKLEEVIIELLKEFDIVAERSKVNTGAWVGNKKIASIGIGVKKWVAFHGLALNVNTPLEVFKLIKPCGLNVDITSMKEIRKREICMDHVKKVFLDKFNVIYSSF